MLKKILFASSLLALAAPAKGALAQCYRYGFGPHAPDHDEHGAIHDDHPAIRHDGLPSVRASRW